MFPPTQTAAASASTSTTQSFQQHRNPSSSASLPLLHSVLLILALLPTPTLSLVKNANIVYGGGCQNGCSGHGTCTGSGAIERATSTSSLPYVLSMFERNGHAPYGGCSCFDGYTGSDCNQRLCPKGRHWANPNFEQTGDETDADAAHPEGVECSGFGYCDRKTGSCNCRAGWEGSACQILSCPTGNNAWGVSETCSGHGKCVLANDYGMQLDRRDPHGLYSNYEDNADASNAPVAEYNFWDADSIKGCECNLGYSGFNCATKDCPWGFDPEVPSVDEIQTLTCSCAATCSGSFKLTYRHGTTGAIPFDATPEVLERALERLPSIVDVEVVTGGSEGYLCPPGGAATTIRWLRDVTRSTVYPLIVADTSDLRSNAPSPAPAPTITVVKTQPTTRIPKECSGRGTCLRESSECKCYEGYFSTSDQRGGLGTRDYSYRDCGVRDPIAVSANFFADYTCPGVSAPGDSSRPVCSSQGVCDGQNYKTCVCNPGYEGGACEWLTCPQGNSWFGKGRKSAHIMMPCSNRGTCDRKSGTCKCPDLYEGSSCHLLGCAKNNSLPCGEKGTCMTMNKIATYSTTNGVYNGAHYNPSSETWDAFKIQACYCRKSFSANSYMWPFDERFPSLDLNTYRGYYAFTHTDTTGFDCSRAECPRGDDPLTLGGLNEVQRINCDATGGNFTIKYRENTTALIYWSDTPNILKAKLEKLPSIGGVNIHASNMNATICSQNHVDVELYTEFGDLPMMTILSEQLTGARGIPQYECAGTTAVSCTPGFRLLGECGSTAARLHRCPCGEGYYSFVTDCTCNCEEITVVNKRGRTSTYPKLNPHCVDCALAEFIGSISGGSGASSGDILTVTSISVGSISIGQTIVAGTGVTLGTQIVQRLTGTGGTGTYKVSVSSSVTSGTTMSAGGVEDFPGESLLGALQISELVKGTKENLECNGHGYCNPDIGMCTCDEGFISSDGQGKPGHRGDCGLYVSETSKFGIEEKD